MRVQLLRYAAGAVTAGVLAAVGVYVLPAGTDEWRPVTYGLAQSPAEVVPAVVSEAQPVRVVSTALDDEGRPVVTVKVATDRSSAEKAVKEAQEAENAVGVEIDAPVHSLDIPTGSDTYRSLQWDFTKIRTVEAWQRSTGAGVTVAVIDTGVDAAHPDLAANVLSGYDAITDTAGVSTDGNGHGTHVAGTIAAVTGNSVGISGIAPDTKILPIKVLRADGGGYMSDTAEGIIWAADNGAQVINMSLGSTSKVATVSNAIAYARSKGVTVVAAAGNSRASGSPTSYPAADEGVIAVAATDSADNYASYSNAGSYVDVAAPGSQIASTVPNNSYSYKSGTSMASPHVAAVAALLEAYQPALTPDQVESILETTSTDQGAAGFDNDYGYGRIDAAAALAAVTPTSSAPTTSPTTTAPTTSTPGTGAPTTAPTTGAPTTAPSTGAPTTAPSTGAPTTAPTTSAPTSAPTSSPTTSPTATPSPTSTSVKPKLTPVVTSTVKNAQVVYGAKTTVTFTVRVSGRAWARKPVSVCVTETGGSVTCTDGTTSTTGAVVVTRTATAGFQVFVNVPESETTKAVTSAVTTYTVKSVVKASRNAKGVMAVALAGAVGQTVQVQQYVGRTWLTVKTYTAVANVTVSGLISGQRYRVVVPDTAAILGATSASVTV